MAKTKYQKKGREVKVKVNPKIYPLEAVYGAAYVFLDKVYIRLDGDPKDKIIVTIRSKKKLNKKEADRLVNDFFDELLSYSLRCEISKQNRRIREYIVGTALLGAAGGEEEKQEEDDWQKDAMGIAVPWEEKYKKK